MRHPDEYEFKILRHLWRQEKLSLRELDQLMKIECGRSFTATRKTLDQMVAKGFLRVERVLRANLYSASQSKIATVAALTAKFAKDILDRDGPLPSGTFDNSRVITPDEVAETEALLNALVTSARPNL